jgi:hypothetical protein
MSLTPKPRFQALGDDENAALDTLAINVHRGQNSPVLSPVDDRSHDSRIVS